MASLEQLAGGSWYNTTCEVLAEVNHPELAHALLDLRLALARVDAIYAANRAAVMRRTMDDVGWGRWSRVKEARRPVVLAESVAAASLRERDALLAELDRRSKIGHARWCVWELGCVCGYSDFVRYVENRIGIAKLISEASSPQKYLRTSDIGHKSPADKIKTAPT